jgi:SHS family lactate transporter-like MFS transporter
MAAQDKTGTDPAERNNDHEADHNPPYHGQSAGQYFATRISTLRPPMLSAPNPIKIIMMLSARQWAFFMVAFCAWVRHPLPPDSNPGGINMA